MLHVPSVTCSFLSVALCRREMAHNMKSLIGRLVLAEARLLLLEILLEVKCFRHLTQTPYLERCRSESTLQHLLICWQSL